MEERKNAVQENQKIKKIIEWPRDTKEMDSKAIQRGFFRKLRYNIAKDRYTFTDYDLFLSLSYTIRDRIIERWIATQQQYHDNDVKRSYYLSLEFLLGRLLDNNIINLGIKNIITEAMKEMGICFEDLEDQEVDAGLGNGGLGRLAACFLDSMATLELPATGYGIRYDFGIFTQKIIDGYQKELPEHWLENVNPWEIERPEYKCRVQFYGNVLYKKDDNGNETAEWLNTETVVAMPYDTPIPGYKNNTVNSLRLWSARSANQIHFEHFQAGDYIAACQDKLTSENISKVLYPNDSNHSGKELRLKQQFFFSSASLQDIIRRYQKHHKDFSEFSTKTAIQLNDTHPAIAIVELMRLLVDEHHVPWNDAWEIVEHTFAYTNHTLMPEALEKWPVSLMRSLLPRHMDIIFKINARFMRQVSYKFPGDNERRKRMSLIEEGGEQLVRMAYLAIVGSHSVNGVARLHTNLLKQGLVRDFYEMWPEKFNNKTNGITQRRWLAKANPPLATLITNTIGDAWIKDLTALKGLKKYAADSAFQKEWCAVKHQCKERLCGKN
jgi:starch phosphorylase